MRALSGAKAGCFPHQKAPHNNKQGYTLAAPPSNAPQDLRRVVFPNFHGSLVHALKMHVHAHRTPHIFCTHDTHFHACTCLRIPLHIEASQSQGPIIQLSAHSAQLRAHLCAESFHSKWAFLNNLLISQRHGAPTLCPMSYWAASFRFEMPTERSFPNNSQQTLDKCSTQRHRQRTL